MQILLTLRDNYHYELKLEAIYSDGKITYTAQLVETAFISNFDEFKVHCGSTIEDAVKSITEALDESIRQLQEI